MGMKTWDCETTIRSHLKRKASPFLPTNYVVAHAFKDQRTPGVTSSYFGKQRPPSGWFRPVLAGCTLLVGMNIKFDIQHALTDADNREAWMKWVADGGLVWDVQLAEYLLGGMSQEHQILSLDELAVRYGQDLKLDEVKLLWAAGVDTPDIEPELLMTYLAGGEKDGETVAGDVQVTEAIALKQIARARATGQLNSILLNCQALVFIAEAEFNGMNVDLAKAAVLQQEVTDELAVAEADLQSRMPADMPRDLIFNWGSRFHKSAIIFGGTVSFPRREYDLADGGTTFDPPADRGDSRYVYANMTETHVVLSDDTTWPANAAHDYPADVEEKLVRVASGKNKGTIKTKKVTVPDYSKPKGRIGKDSYAFPRQVTPKKEWESADPGVYSTAADVIDQLDASKAPLLKAFVKQQALRKDLSTYYLQTDEDGNKSGMLALVDADGCIHHKINQTATVTGRLSSSDPNLQNVPKGSKSKIKQVFTSRFPGGKVCQSDFSSLEIYIQAILTGSVKLIDALRAGLDMHVARLAASTGMDYAELLRLCKGYTDENGVHHEAVKEWDYKRTGSKVFSFQRAYGAGAPKIAATTGMPIEAVESLIEAESKLYPEVDTYYEGLTERLKRERVAPAGKVPHPKFPGVLCSLGEATYAAPDGKVYRYKEEPAPEYLVRKGILQSFSPTQIKNYVVQGEGAEWAKAACYLAVREFYRRRNFGHRALLVNQVHDAVYGDFAPEVAFEAAAVLHACMEAASDYMAATFKWDIPLPVPSDTTWGASMADEDSIEGIAAAAAPVRVDLRTRYLKGFRPNYLEH